MPEPLDVRITHWLRHVEEPGVRRLLVECREALKVAPGGEWTGARVMAWMEENEISLVPWQRQRLEKL